MTSPWQEWKKKNLEAQQSGKTSPSDFFNPNTPKASKEVAKHRLAVCAGCPEYVKSTSQCRKCGCVMKAKTKLLYASCPLMKWV